LYTQEPSAAFVGSVSTATDAAGFACTKRQSTAVHTHECCAARRRLAPHLPLGNEPRRALVRLLDVLVVRALLASLASTASKANEITSKSSAKAASPELRHGRARCFLELRACEVLQLPPVRLNEGHVVVVDNQVCCHVEVQRRRHTGGAFARRTLLLSAHWWQPRA
jgi:hypothetical protein